MSNRGGENVTRYEAEKLMTQMLQDYETKVVVPRHEETQSSLTEIKNIMQRGIGAAWFASIVASGIGIWWVVVQIRGTH